MMKDFFRMLGIFPELSDFFMILLNILEMGFFVIFRTVPKTPSGPGAAPPGKLSMAELKSSNGKNISSMFL